MKRLLAVLIIGTATTAPLCASAETTLTPEQYLQKVKADNDEVKAAIAASEGALQRAEGANLSTAFTLFADAEFARDAALPLLPFVTYDTIESQRATLGIRKTTTFGLDAKIYYLARKTHYINQSAGPLPQINWYDTRPTIELTQSLWANGFGRTTRATIEAAEAGAKAQSYAESFRAKNLIAAAEQAYWRLALAQERVEVVSRSLEQAQKFVQLSQDKFRRNLIDEVDLLQAKSAFEGRQLELEGAKEEARSAARLFNRFLNQVSEQVPYSLAKITSDELMSRSAPEEVPQRDDVRAAQEQQRASIASANASIEAARPVLDITGSYALNGRDANTGAALGDPFRADRPAFSIGMKFAMPLDRGLASDVMAGWRTEQMAAELSYRKKAQDLKQDWEDLVQRIAHLKSRLKLNQRLVAAQKAKLERERERLASGRTTTFQVLSFEQEFAQSQVSEINVKAELVQALAQLKVYGDKI